jgi:hypothetical protein
MGEAVNIDWDGQPIGKMPDHALAKRLRVSPGVVQHQRYKRGLSAYVKASGSGVSCGIDWNLQPLATTPAATLAARLGVSRASVDNAAKVRGIKCPPLRPVAAPTSTFAAPSDYDYGRLLSRLPRVARVILERRRLEHWIDDVVQHAAMKVYELHRSGRKCGHRATRLCVLGAIQELFGTTMGAMHFAPLDAVRHVPCESGDSAFRSIALWRLQETWATLTELERGAVFATLTGTGTDSAAVFSARIKLGTRSRATP